MLALSVLLAQPLAPVPALAAELSHDYNYNKQMTQQDAMGFGSNNYWNGSGDSKDEGVRNGMRAMGRLASLDIGGAIHYGYKGYGNYINSQRMDDLDSRAWKKKDTMNSVSDEIIRTPKITGGISSELPYSLAPRPENAKLPAEAAKAGPPPGKKWKDMDRGFLYKGETNEVAADFEKKTGMSREEFFNHVADAADANLSFDDPDLLNNLERRFLAFKAGVRNADFKSKLEKAHSMFSFMKKTEMLAEAAAFYQKTRGGEPGSQEMLADKAPGGAPNAPAADAGRALASAEPAAPQVALQSNSDPRVAKLSKDQMGVLLGIGSHGDELSGLLISAEDTIFKVVSKRYRKLAPALTGKAL